MDRSYDEISPAASRKGAGAGAESMRSDQRWSEIYAEGALMAYIFNFHAPGPVIFPTAEDAEMQCGFGDIPVEKEIKAHIHKDVDRRLSKTSEFIFIMEGEMLVTFIAPSGEIVSEALIRSGEAFLQYFGGHKIVFSAGTRYFELKQGPYLGHDCDKVLI